MDFRSADLPDTYKALNRYPVRLAQPVYFRDSLSPALGGTWANGSGCLLRFGARIFGVTCRHVIEAYRERRALERGAVFRFGGAQFEPDDHLVAENAKLDIATLDLTQFVGDAGLTPAACIEPVRWPPGDISTDDVLAYAGFPGVWREEVATDHLRFYSFGSGASGVHSVGTSYLYTRVEPKECLAALEDRLVIGSLGGLSGGPVFVWRTGLVVTAEFVGIVSEYQETYDLLYVARANCVQEDGTLQAGK
jgi:hypothetical protein